MAGGADWLGVLDIPEALQLRAAGIREPILTWMHAPEQDFAAAVAAGIDIGVSTLEQVHALGRLAGGDVPRMQIKVDTGLSRNGAVPEQWDAVFAAAADYERRGALTVTGIFSHLANAGAQADAAQLDAFHACRRAWPRRPASTRRSSTSPPRPGRWSDPRRGSTWCASGSASTGCCRSRTARSAHPNSAGRCGRRWN